MRTIQSKKIRFLTKAALIAALYTVLTLVASFMGLDKGVFQLRFSEMLTVLPAFIPAAAPGLFVGCLISNMITGAAIWDVVFGSLATLIGAVLTYLLRRWKFLSSVPPILANSLIMPPVIIAVYGTALPYPLVLLGVFVGETVCAGVLGLTVIGIMKKYGKHFER